MSMKSEEDFCDVNFFHSHAFLSRDLDYCANIRSWFECKASIITDTSSIILVSHYDFFSLESTRTIGFDAAGARE